MAKTHKLSSSWGVKDGILSLTIEARDPDAGKDAAALSSFSRDLDLNSMSDPPGGYNTLDEAGKGGMEFGIFTALRNSTGSCDTISEAEVSIDRRLDAFANREWGAEREGSAVPFNASHSLSMAVERASKGAQTAAQAAERLSVMTEEACTANSLPAFASLEGPERSKLRKQVVDSIIKSKPAIALAYQQVELQKAKAAQARKEATLAAALAAAAGADGPTGATL